MKKIFKEIIAENFPNLTKKTPIKLQVQAEKTLKNPHQDTSWDFPGGASGKEPTCQCRRHKRCGFNPYIGKIP